MNYYRYTNIRYASPLDEFDNPIGTGRLDVLCQEYQVTKTTKCGVWLTDTYNIIKPFFVLNTAKKRYALPSKKEALESFMARKKRQISILSRQMKDAEEALRIATTLLAKEEE